MSEASFGAAQALRMLKNHRSCISRAYHAAFAAVTSEVRKKTAFPMGYEHPPHGQMKALIKKYLARFRRQDRNDIQDALARLRDARLDADYRPGADPDDASARSATRDARFVLESLGVNVR